jgi:hypothetical protein
MNKLSDMLGTIYGHALCTALLAFCCAIAWRHPDKFDAVMAYATGILFTGAVGHHLYHKRKGKNAGQDQGK